MAFSALKIETLVGILAKETGRTSDDLFDAVVKADPTLLPKSLLMKLDDGKYGLKPVKTVRVWGSLAAKTTADEYGLTEEDITERTGKNGVIVLSDVKNAYRQKQGAPPEPPKEKKAAKPKKAKKPEPDPEPESEDESEGEEFEDEE